MVGLSDIPCVRVAVDKISEATVEAGIGGLRYLFCYKDFVNNLNSEIEKVKIQEEGVARKVAEAKDDGKIIENHVVAWQENLENIKTRADQLIRQRTFCTCFKVLHFPNPVSRFQLGRKAACLAKIVTEQTDSGKEFLANEIAHHPPIENVPNSDTSYQSFGSRTEAYGKLWEALVDDDGYPVVGIYGMPGVGKTRMMEQAWKESRDMKIFDKVTRANVGGEKLDVIKLQDQLASYLNCHLESKDNELNRASQLKNSLMNGDKTLVILDDVWDVIPLINIGIPFGDVTFKGCKILLTSRKQNVCLANNCTDPIEIRTLTETEAWEMFRNTVGNQKIVSLQDQSLAMKVCKECGALPLLIDAVGKALKVLTENSWEDALSQIENCNFEEIDGINSKVYTFLDFSFKNLKKGEKACLLLCSFFPEDADIDIKMLFDLAKGSGLLDSTRKIGGLVDILKSSSLLLQGKDDYTVKVHDVIRGVARSIAATDPNYAFLSRRCSSRLADNVEYRTRRLLHLDMEESNIGFPDDLVCPELHTLWMQFNKHSQQLSSQFFNTFMNLKVLLLEGKRLFDDQLSIHTLEKLRVLILDGCEISQTFISSVSGSLETLCIRYCELPCPLDLPELKYLRKLELVQYCWIKMGAKSISRLSSLEELNIPSGFEIWDDADDTSISWELSQLRFLRNLVIRFYGSHHYPDKDIFPSLVEFNILVGHSWDSLWDEKRKCAISLDRSYIASRLMALVERAELVKLRLVKGLPNGFSDSNMREGFTKLRELKIHFCDEMKHVASWDRRNLRAAYFSNLSIVDIYGCNGLKYVFSSSVAKCLLQMQKLSVRDCLQIEGIIRVDESSDHGEEIICFPKLKELDLVYLPSLTSFYSKEVTFPNMTRLHIKNLNISGLTEEIELGGDDHSSPKLTEVKVLYDNSQLRVLPSLWKLQLQNLETLALKNCWGAENSLLNGALNFNILRKLEVDRVGVSTLSTSSVFRSFQQLEELRVSNCSLLKEIVEVDASGDGTNQKTPISLLKLKLVFLSNLPNLHDAGISACYMPALETVEVKKCGLISTLFTRTAFRNLQQLHNLEVSGCPLLEEIVEDEMDDVSPGTSEKMISLLLLETIELRSLPRLRTFGSSSTFTFNMPALYAVSLHECPCMDKSMSLLITAPLVKIFSDDN